MSFIYYSILTSNFGGLYEKQPNEWLFFGDYVYYFVIFSFIGCMS